MCYNYVRFYLDRIAFPPYTISKYLSDRTLTTKYSTANNKKQLRSLWVYSPRPPVLKKNYKRRNRNRIEAKGQSGKSIFRQYILGKMYSDDVIADNDTPRKGRLSIQPNVKVVCAVFQTAVC